MIQVLLSHDVDWAKNEPSQNHILNRRNRFSEEDINKVLQSSFNPYNNIDKLIEIEERLGVRSTFFFRAYYNNGTDAECYAEEIKSLVKEKWEIGVHFNGNSLSDMLSERRIIDKLSGVTSVGCRKHNLSIFPKYYNYLEYMKFKYDSSIIYSKNKIDDRNLLPFRINKINVYPITIMDAYIFTYMHLYEKQIISLIEKTLKNARTINNSIVTLLWHDASLRMIGGRIYPEVLEYITSQDDVEVKRGIDLLTEPRYEKDITPVTTVSG